VGSASHAQQTAQIMIRLETAIEKLGPDIVLVYGDVNSTMAAALVCAKVLIPVGHVEAGLRSFDRTMPEEVNRVVTDRLSDLLFTPSADGDQNLLQEGVPRERIHLVGNVMVDTLIHLLPQALERFDDEPLRRWSGKEYVLVTLHRPSNVDEPDSLFEILRALERIAADLPVIFPVHPRTEERMRASGVSVSGPLHLIDPLSYLDFLALEARARLVITDSGGVQEETTFLRVPCLTLRANTERPITVTQGTNTLVGQNLERLVTEARRILKGSSKGGEIPPLWDGHAGERIANVICNHDWRSIRNRDEQRAIHYR
jgi:UDP-N-acetylglucosamine 2-epimerase (non-hydrolysing)